MDVQRGFEPRGARLAIRRQACRPDRRAGPTIAEPVSCAIMRRRKGEICFAVSIGRLASMKNGVPYSNAIICHGRPCRAEVRKWPALYRYPARDGQSPTTCKVDARSAHSTGLKTRSAAGRAPLNLVGGYRFSNATEIEADLACAHKNRLQCGASASELELRFGRGTRLPK